MPEERRSSSARRARPAGTHRVPRRRPARVVRSAAKVAASLAVLATGAAIGVGAFAVLGIGPFHEARVPERASSTTVDTAAQDVPPESPGGGANAALPDSTTTPQPAQTPQRAQTPQPPRTLPLGTRATSTIAARTTQVVVVRGTTATANTAIVEYYERHGADWIRVAAWQGHVGKRGWATHHQEGDLKTPVGTFALSDAGGRRPDPGTSLTYHRSADFLPPPAQPGFGDSMADAFDYVIAVDYNRVPGRSPLDLTRPLGARRGGGIWLHVDHGGPTHGCISIPQAGVRYLLLHLRLNAHPVVVMGPQDQLAL